jgi:hypothetical protein
MTNEIISYLQMCQQQVRAVQIAYSIYLVRSPMILLG